MKVKTIKAHLRQVKKRLIKTKDNIQGYEYWTKENKFGVVELEKWSYVNILDTKNRTFSGYIFS